SVCLLCRMQGSKIFLICYAYIFIIDLYVHAYVCWLSYGPWRSLRSRIFCAAWLIMGLISSGELKSSVSRICGMRNYVFSHNTLSPRNLLSQLLHKRAAARRAAEKFRRFSLLSHRKFKLFMQ